MEESMTKSKLGLFGPLKKRGDLLKESSQIVKKSSPANEREFYDQWASKINLHSIDVYSYFEGSTSPENRYILKHLDTLEGKEVLDLGCGAGENSVYFAKKGANCVAADISPKMVKVALEFATKHDMSIEGKVINAMEIDFSDNTFDIVYAANLLHHVNPSILLKEAYRVLKPGGKLCFWDPLRHNPIINIYRRIVKDLRTVDEIPLDIRIVDEVRSLFSHVEYDTFWYLSLWIFIKFYIFERVDPNKEPYWKKIITEESRLRKQYYKLERFDNFIKEKFPALKRFAWNIAVIATK